MCIWRYDDDHPFHVDHGATTGTYGATDLPTTVLPVGATFCVDLLEMIGTTTPSKFPCRSGHVRAFKTEVVHSLFVQSTTVAATIVCRFVVVDGWPDVVYVVFSSRPLF